MKLSLILLLFLTSNFANATIYTITGKYSRSPDAASAGGIQAKQIAGTFNKGGQCEVQVLNALGKCTVARPSCDAAGVVCEGGKAGGACTVQTTNPGC